MAQQRSFSFLIAAQLRPQRPRLADTHAKSTVQQNHEGTELGSQTGRFHGRRHGDHVSALRCHFFHSSEKDAADKVIDHFCGSPVPSALSRLQHSCIFSTRRSGGGNQPCPGCSPRLRLAKVSQHCNGLSPSFWKAIASEITNLLFVLAETKQSFMPNHLSLRPSDCQR